MSAYLAGVKYNKAYIGGSSVSVIIDNISYLDNSPPYWVELVRSTSETTLRESAGGSYIWLRTSDGEPVEQEFFAYNNWGGTRFDQVEPDYLLIHDAANGFRCRKSNFHWLPTDNGIRWLGTGRAKLLSYIPWNGRSTYRFFEGRYG